MSNFDAALFVLFALGLVVFMYTWGTQVSNWAYLMNREGYTKVEIHIDSMVTRRRGKLKFSGLIDGKRFIVNASEINCSQSDIERIRMGNFVFTTKVLFLEQPPPGDSALWSHNLGILNVEYAQTTLLSATLYSFAGCFLLLLRHLSGSAGDYATHNLTKHD